MEQGMNGRTKGLGFLILFYAFVMIQNVMGWRQFGGSALLVSIISGTLVYMTVGLIRRKTASWFIAIAFHILYQLIITLTTVALSSTANLRELYKVLPAETVPSARQMIVIAFSLLTLANALSIIYLFKNRKHFVESEARD